MASTAEESLMALLEAMLTLAASEVIRPKPPSVKPGGYPEEHFLDLTEEEKDEFCCNICYQVLKETRQCMNKHKFCSSCLLVWSTTGQYNNRDGCPVCRTRGDYLRNLEVDDRISAKKVKCLLESCKWSGLLKHLCSHRHTTYGDSSSSESEDTGVSEVMPRLIQVTPHVPHRGQGRFIGTGLTIQNPSPSAGPPPASSSRMSLLSSRSVSRASPSPFSSTSEETVTELPWRSGPSTRRFSTFRTPGIQAPTNNRIYFSHTRPSTDNNNNLDDEASVVRSSTSTVDDSLEMAANSMSGGLTPRPPSTPRTSSNVVNARRLPRIVNPPPARAQGHRYQPPSVLALHFASGGRPRAAENLGEIRDRLHESRTRLDNLMTSFSGELDRNRQAMAEFQLERERHRQEQLEEVRELGQRLGQVASELRRLLEQRRHIHSFSDDDDDFD
ncbi:unnamed protein product [Candidula unifasciata]|uniref:RING-type domain-containing protein n=1 Tax=Candidula unifasciata TaxID=100452 RepID=A0A8S3Z854_9EUPU|nr:unnamed protein product [Candidula unifasciata]